MTDWILAALIASTLLVAFLAHQPNPCADYIEGTDIYHECITGEPIDLTPIQDEADSPTSNGRD